MHGSRSHNRRHLPAAVCAGVFTGLAVVLLSLGPALAAQRQVDIRDFAFAPPGLTVVVGDGVTWTNHDSFDHTVTFDAGPATPDSGRVSTDATFSITFTRIGSYHYHCSIHPAMTGTLEVQGQTTYLPLLVR